MNSTATACSQSPHRIRLRHLTSRSFDVPASHSFLAYELLVARELQRTSSTRAQLPLSSAMMYGAAAGYAMWLT